MSFKYIASSTTCTCIFKHYLLDIHYLLNIASSTTCTCILQHHLLHILQHHLLHEHVPVNIATSSTICTCILQHHVHVHVYTCIFQHHLLHVHEYYIYDFSEYIKRVIVHFSTGIRYDIISVYVVGLIHSHTHNIHTTYTHYIKLVIFHFRMPLFLCTLPIYIIIHVKLTGYT